MPLRPSRPVLKSTLLLAGFGLASAWVAAQSGPGTGNAQIPYQGHLERGGVAVSTPMHVRVGLFSTANASTSCLSAANISGCGVWRDEFPSVPMSEGRFSILLGSRTALGDDVFRSDALYLAIAVADPADGSFTVLSGLQRLASVPYAVRAETAKNLIVDGSLFVQDDDNEANPDIGQFYAQNLTQGVGIGYNRVQAIGSNASQELHLVPKGVSPVVVDGPLSVTGDANIAGALQANGAVTSGATLNYNDSPSSYHVDRGRYLVYADYSGYSPTRRWVEIPEHVLLSYCGDEDGCTIRMGMRNWQGDSSQPRGSTSMGPFVFFYGDLNGSSRYWRRSETVASANASQIWHAANGYDGNGTIQHVAQDHDCYFTDGFYALGSGGSNDTNRGMGLLNWAAHGYTPRCWLAIDD